MLAMWVFTSFTSEVNELYDIEKWINDCKDNGDGISDNDCGVKVSVKMILIAVGDSDDGKDGGVDDNTDDIDDDNNDNCYGVIHTYNLSC